MSDAPIPRMYGITCSNSKNGAHAFRLGKEILAPKATNADLRDALASRYGKVNSDTCDVCNTGIQFSLDQVRFVGDMEEPAYTEAVPTFD
jgi:hypothetical protein